MSEQKATPALTVIVPAPVTVTAPDTNKLVTTFTDKIHPLAGFRVTDDASYIKAKAEHFGAVRDYLDEVGKLFNDAVAAANKAHKGMTGIRAAFADPATKVKDHIQAEILAYETEQKRLVAIEEARLNKERLEEARREQERREAELEAERPPWEEAEPKAAPVPVEIAPIRLASPLPVIAGGAKTADKPWAARLVDEDLLWETACRNPDARQFFSFDQVRANVKAKELQADLGKAYPGLEGYRGQTLKKG